MSALNMNTWWNDLVDAFPFRYTSRMHELYCRSHSFRLFSFSAWVIIKACSAAIAGFTLRPTAPSWNRLSNRWLCISDNEVIWSKASWFRAKRNWCTCGIWYYALDWGGNLRLQKIDTDSRVHCQLTSKHFNDKQYRKNLWCQSRWGHQKIVFACHAENGLRIVIISVWRLQLERWDSMITWTDPHNHHPQVNMGRTTGVRFTWRCLTIFRRRLESRFSRHPGGFAFVISRTLTHPSGLCS
jgi:hypothetical protein